MPRRRGNLLTSGRRFLTGPKLALHKRFRRHAVPDLFVPVYVDGKPLNIPESKIYRALTDLGIEFEAQKQIGGGRVLGGGLVDFWLPRHRVAIEFQGPFHATAEGRARDWLRAITRSQYGAKQVIYLYERDLEDLHERLREVLGMVAVQVVATRSW